MGSTTSTPIVSQLSLTPSPTAAAAEGCPMREGSPPSNPTINPLNRMPATPQQSLAPGQSIALPLQRTMSTIPRSSATTTTTGETLPPSACPVNKSSSPSSASSSDPAATATTKKVDAWEYPSPQQFYNALVRKGWETPEESIVMMVDIHNWLNEAAWQQVRVWEEKHDGGDRSQLARFEGRPQDISPKARYHMFMSKILPSRYHYVKPFDRHDWLIHRPSPSSPSTSSYTAPSSTQPYTTHRYVIDYYSLPDDETGNPVFSLDVRPAVDSVSSAKERVDEWWRVKKASWSAVGEQASAIGVKVQEEK